MSKLDTLSIAYQTSKALACTLDALGRQLTLDAPTSIAVRSAVYLIGKVLAPQITTAADVAVIGTTIAETAALIAAGAPSRDAAAAFADAATAATVAVPTYTSPARTRSGALGRMLAACAEAAFLGQSFVAEAKSDFGDQNTAIAARQRIAEAMDVATDRIAAAAGRDVIGLLVQVANIASGHIASVAADLRPIVRVQSLRSAPSTALAFELYGDPARAEELVRRNSVATPLFMPVVINALAADA